MPDSSEPQRLDGLEHLGTRFSPELLPTLNAGNVSSNVNAGLKAIICIKPEIQSS